MAYNIIVSNRKKVIKAKSAAEAAVIAGNIARSSTTPVEVKVVPA